MKILISIFFLLFFTINADFVDTSLILKVEEKYGKFAKNRFIALNTMLEKSKNSDLRTKLEKINDFFNDIKYASDQTVYGTSDYWANPYEFLAKDKGDCEDYAIAKYFSLIKLGIPDDKLRITYVIYKKANSRFEQAHMVLTYYHKTGAEPVILDNINRRLELASKRDDLKPVYSFNASGLWQAKNKGDTRVGDNNLKSWKNLIGRF